MKFLFGWRLIFALVYLLCFTAAKTSETGIAGEEKGYENVPVAASTKSGQSKKDSRPVFKNVKVVGGDAFEAEIAALIDEMYKGSVDK